MAACVATIDRERLRRCLQRETVLFEQRHQQSKAAHERASRCMVAGVPMCWMLRLPGSWPISIASGKGAQLEDIDGNTYVDLCLGDTGGMCGHAPAPVVEAATRRLQQGHTFMLPVEDATVVCEELTKRFGLPFWQATLSATDANRFALRVARQITGRSKILVFNYCYHGTVDETFVTLQGPSNSPASRPGNIGPAYDPALTTKVIEFNDVSALAVALEAGDVAAVLAEPAMTNIGIILPDKGYHEALRELTLKTGTLLIIDETHTICAGPGGYTGRYGLTPDLLTLGKPVAGGVPSAVLGMSSEVATKFNEFCEAHIDTVDVAGVGGTLAGNALTFAAMRATLEQVLTPAAYERMDLLAVEWTNGVQSVIDQYHLPWIVQRLGCRAEYWFRRVPPHNGGEAFHAADAELERYMHLAALNRGVLLTPFHNMALMCPATTAADVAAHTAAFADSVAQLCA
eukprot:TRINITY_DN5426_c0_g1_i3.p1 TRINITY_DN5426_c0_g1~~TRINITY_DN5426_c0_g1_i3.p1  ORF type:complete len:459 (+),score=113.69 TRINITY_DN5426_c0_g1_i3:2223-3599(+)